MRAAPPPPPLPDGSSNNLRLYACQRYGRWVADGFRAEVAEKALDGADPILLSLFERSARTYEAIVRWLGDRAFAEQGLVLTRSLFEDMIDAHWVSLHRAQAVRRYAQHDRYRQVLLADVQRRHPRMFGGRDPEKVKIGKGKRKELRARFGASGAGSWTGEPELATRVRQVLPCWPTKPERRAVEFWHVWLLQLGTETLHAPPPGERRLGGTPEWLTQALLGALWTYAQTVGLVAPHFGVATRGQCAAEFERAMRDFAQASHWEQTGKLEYLPPPRPT